MPIYKLPCVWEVMGYMHIQADTMEEAIQEAYDRASLPDGEYVENSFAVDHEFIEEEQDGQPS